MALQVYLKGVQQPLLLKGSMKDFDEKLKMYNKRRELDTFVFRFETWIGYPIVFLNPHELWSHIVEKKDSVVKKEIADAEKTQKDKQKAMDKAQGKNVIQTLNPRFPGRGH